MTCVLIARFGCFQERYEKYPDAGNERYDLARRTYSVDPVDGIPT